MTTRAERRAQKRRNFARVKAKMEVHGPVDIRYIRRMASHGKTCSCAACGNPRHHFGGPTIQERKQLEKENAL